MTVEFVSKEAVPQGAYSVMSAAYAKAYDENAAIKLDASTHNEKSIRTGAAAFARARGARASIRKSDGFLYVWFDKE